MQRLAFSTADVSEREQLGYWRDLGSRYFLPTAWERDAPSAAPFRGPTTVRQLGAVRPIGARRAGHRSEFGRAFAARAAADVLIVEQEVSGPSRYVIGRRSLACGPGDLLLLSPDARFEEDGS